MLEINAHCYLRGGGISGNPCGNVGQVLKEQGKETYNLSSILLYKKNDHLNFSLIYIR